MPAPGHRYINKTIKSPYLTHLALTDFYNVVLTHFLKNLLGQVRIKFLHKDDYVVVQKVYESGH